MGKSAHGRTEHQAGDVKGQASLPPWIRVRLAAEGSLADVSEAIRQGGLNTVCESARCPNRHECFNRGTATIMILGNTCTRNCSFCAVENGAPPPVDPGEPRRVAKAAGELALKHVVITSVTRDDLADGGASVFADVIYEVRKALPAATIEVLTPDFGGKRQSVITVLDAGPDVYNHNLETVRRLQQLVRPDADYDRSLAVLRVAAASTPTVAVKSGLMVGLGETDDEVLDTMADLFAVGCSFLTIGQYLAPSRDHIAVQRYVEPETFLWFEEEARKMGFSGVAAAPLVRSSYRAGDMLK